jgi:hypothetical protein
MKHFYTTVEGWLHPSQKTLYTNQVKQAKDKAHFVEVGSWKGKSGSYMAVEIINREKNIKFDAVDTWLGASEHQKNKSIKDGTLYDEFLHNTKSVNHIINPIQMASVEASKLYEDNSLDFVFIDAGHEYEFVKEDIEHWLPKIRENGIIAGDDYDTRAWGRECHPGVKKAVDELLPKAIIDRVTWIYRK